MNCSYQKKISCFSNDKKLLLSTLQDNLQEWIKNADQIKVQEGQTLFYEGHAPYGIYILLEGCVDFIQDTREKSANQFGRMIAHQPYGFDLVLSKCLYPFTAVASKASKLLFISKNLLNL